MRSDLRAYLLDVLAVSPIKKSFARERAAGIYSLIETCKLNGIASEAYLRSVLAEIADHPINRVAEILPWKWAEAHKKLRSA
jgi:hypothetical protein